MPPTQSTGMFILSLRRAGPSQTMQKTGLVTASYTKHMYVHIVTQEGRT